MGQRIIYHNNITRIRYISLSTAVAASMIVMASSSAKVWAQDTEELGIGVLSALTGGGISWGMAVLGGVELAAEEINDVGGLKVGDKTYKLKIIAYDDKYAGPPAAQRLVSQDGVKIIFGPFGSVPVLATADIVESEGILSFINSCGGIPGLGQAALKLPGEGEFVARYWASAAPTLPHAPSTSPSRRSASP